MAVTKWEVEAQKARDILDKSIPKQWLLPEDKLPSSERTNVLDVPKESGLLTERELEITETDATGLVEAMAKGTWTAEEVTTAFLKRATIGHQLVTPLTAIRHIKVLTLPAQLRRRVHGRRRTRASSRAR